jgi:hypothetical protein
VNKIPVGDTIAHAYKFTLENLGAIIGLIWLPMVISTVGAFFVQTYYSATLSTAAIESRPAEAGQAMLSMIAWTLLSFLLGAVMYTSVTRQALGLRKGPAYISLSLGLQEFRVFGAEMALFGIAVAFGLFYLVGISALAGIAGRPGAQLLGLAALLSALAGAFAIFYCIVRLSFLLFPATIVENKIGLSRSWMLTRGNFWRIVAIGLATVGPIAVVIGIGEYLILGPEYFRMAMAAATADAAAQAKISEAETRMMTQHLPLLLGLSLLIAPFTVGLALGAASFAYRVLTPAKPAL